MPELKQVATGDTLEAQRAHWSKLHEYAPQHANDWNAEKAAEWLDEWSTVIPGLCACKQKWQSLIDQVPPRLETATEFFVWSWEVHNYVSQNHANRPTITLAQAYQEWWDTA